MVQSEKDKVTDLWRTKCSLIFDRVKVLHKNLQKRVLDKNPTDEERKRLMTLKDDPDFLLFHNGNLKTKEVQQLSGFVADVKFGRTIPNPDRDYELKCALMDVEEINKHVTLISAEDANAYMARDPNMKDETEENKLNWCCNWTTERNDYLSYLQALLPPLMNKLKDMPADPEEKQRLTDMTEDATFLKYRDLHSLHPKIEFYVGLLQEVMQGNTGYMDRLFQSGLTEADYPGLFFFEEITSLQTFTNAYPNFHPDDLKKVIFTKTELVASMGPLKYYSLLVPLQNDAGFQEFKQTQHQHLHLSYFQYLLTNSPLEQVPSEKYPNLKNFLECLVCVQVSQMLKEEVDKFSVLKLTEAVKAKHNFGQMEPDEQNNFITQWNTEYNYLTTRLQRHSAIVDEQITAFPIYQQVELFHDIAQNHEAFKNYLPQVSHHRSWLRLKDSIDNFTNTFDSFFSLKDQTYFSNVIYLKEANTLIAILEGNRQPSSYIMKAHKFDEMSPAQQESYLQAYKQSLVPYIQELKDIRNNLKTFIDENHMDADEFKRKLPKLKKNKGDEHDVHPTMMRLKQISDDALHLSANWKYSPFDEKDKLILSHYFNYLECKDVLQLLKPQSVEAETLTTFGNQTFDAEEKIWLTKMAKEHVKDVRNNIRKMKCHFKAKYEIVSLGMGSRCVRGEKDWKPLIKAFMQDPVCRQFHKENELTVNLLAERSRSYKHFTKYNYDIVTGSEQFLQIKRILDTSPNINIKELEVLKNSLKGRHETYNTKVQQLSPLLTSPHFYKYYLEDATTMKICELSSGAKDSFLRRVVTTFVEDSTYEAYLHMITSYMLANAHKRYLDEMQRCQKNTKISKHWSPMTKALYRVQKTELEDHRAVANAIADVMSFYNIYGKECEEIVNSPEKMADLESKWNQLQQDFMGNKINAYLQCISLSTSLSLHVDFDNARDMIASVRLQSAKPATTLHNSLSAEDQHAIAECYNFMILQHLFKDISTKVDELPKLVSLMTPLEDSFFRVHQDARLSSLAESFFSVVFSSSADIRKAHFDTVMPEVKQILKDKKMFLRELELFFRPIGSSSSVEVRGLTEYVALKRLEKIEEITRQPNRNPSKYELKKAFGDRVVTDTEKQEWEKRWRKERESCATIAKHACSEAKRAWDTERLRAHRERASLTFRDFLVPLLYAEPSPLVNVEKVFTHSTVKEKEVEENITNSKINLCFFVPPAENEGHHDQSHLAEDLHHLEFDPSLMLKKDELVLLDAATQEVYVESHRISEELNNMGKKGGDRSALLKKLKENKKLLREATTKEKIEEYYLSKPTVVEYTAAKEAMRYTLAAKYLQQCDQELHRRISTTAGLWSLTEAEMLEENDDIYTEIKRLDVIMSQTESWYLAVTENKYAKVKCARFILGLNNTAQRKVQAQKDDEEIEEEEEESGDEDKDSMLTIDPQLLVDPPLLHRQNKTLIYEPKTRLPPHPFHFKR